MEGLGPHGREGAADVVGAGVLVELGLGAGGLHALDELGQHGDAECVGERAGETLGLVELALALLHRMERDGDDSGALLGAQGRDGLAQNHVGEEWLEPKLAVVFVAVDDGAQEVVRDHGGASPAEMQVKVAAVRALEGGGDVAGEGQAAAFAAGRRDEAEVLPASLADVALSGRGAGVAAKLADRGEEKAQAGVEPLAGRGVHRGAGARSFSHRWNTDETQRGKAGAEARVLSVSNVCFICG